MKTIIATVKTIIATVAALLVLCGEASTCPRVLRVQEVEEIVLLDNSARLEVPFVPVQLVRVRERVILREIQKVEIREIQKVQIQKVEKVVIRKRAPILNRPILPLRCGG